MGIIPETALTEGSSRRVLAFVLSCSAADGGVIVTGDTRMQMPENTSAIATLAWVARAHAVASKSYAGAAEDFLAANRVPEQARQIYKAAIGASDSSLAPPGISLGAWSDSARTTSAFYRILSDNGFVRTPMHAKIGMASSEASAGVVPEGKAIPVSKVVLGNVLLTPQKVAALVVVTDTLLLNTGADGQSAFNRELLSVISAAIDSAFLDRIDTGLTPITSSGPLADLRAAMLAVTGGGLARPYWIASTDVGKLAATLGTTKSGAATAAASMVGGELANLPLLISSGCPAGTLYLVDAAQVAANGEAPTLAISTQADVQLDTVPNMDSSVPTAAAMTSMFATNSTALLSSALFACEKLRSTAVSVVTGITSTTWAAT
jgi:hypothetical protein